MSGKSFIAVVISFACGVVAGGYFIGTTCAKRYKDRIEELERQNSGLAEKLEAKKPNAMDISSERPSEDLSNEQNSENDYRLDVAKLSRDYHNGDFDVHFADRAHPEDDEEEKSIRIIDKDEFVRSVDTMDAETLTYYKENNMLVDAADMPIHDEEECIGMECLELLENADDSVDFVYVDNDTENKLYEIIVEHNQNFYRDVMGMDMV